jgi:Zn-dependent M28 family amino/carboxypeptidase
MLVLLIPNPHNRDDNTSGVIGLLALAHWLKDQPHLRSQVQFVFLDNEEWGLLGSSALKQQWDKTGYPYHEAAVINLDCISRGQIPLLVHHGRDTLAQRLAPHLQKQFPQTKLLNLGILPLSDNYTFKKTGAVDISFADPSTIPGGYHIPRIHTPADNDFNIQQVTHLIECLVGYLRESLTQRREEAKDAKGFGNEP